MTRFRTSGRWFRIAIAVAFGFMSLGHGPIMTFAHAGAAGAHDHAIHAPAEHTGDHQTTDADDCHEAVPAVHDVMFCNAFGCFISVAAAPVTAPSQQSAPIGKLLPAALQPGFAASLEPADPPPRLHV